MAFADQERLRALLRCPQCRSPLRWRSEGGRCRRCGQEVIRNGRAFVFPGPALPADYDRPGYASGNPYHRDCLELIEGLPNGVLLNVGAGSPRFTFPNLVELEIRKYPSTDVVTAGGRLPFADGSADGVISLSVLEHVPDPFLFVAEIERVLKPGAICVLHSAFNQPYHGAPHHYFNSTRPALEWLFRKFVLERAEVGAHQHPWLILRWFLCSYLSGMPVESDRQWLRDRTVGELMTLLDAMEEGRNRAKSADDAHAVAAALRAFNREHAEQLGPLLRIAESTVEELAGGYSVTARKPTKSETHAHWPGELKRIWARLRH